MADAVTDEVVDVAFHLPGGRLPIDHAYALFSAISAALPWFANDSAARLHQVHTAATGSGWMRPEEMSSEALHLSRRTRLKLRVSEHRAEKALGLSGCVLDIDGYSLTPGAGRILPLVPAGTLLARHVLCEDDEDESHLVARLDEALRNFGVNGAKLICGRAHRIATPDAMLQTRSIVVTNLDSDGALCLLRHGIGPAGKLGCGIFIPYKRIE